MGLFGKIKNILFEEDDEVEEMPVYTKEEVKEQPVKNVHVDVERPAPVVEEPIKTNETTHFKNVKRDIDISFEEQDVFDDIPGGMETVKNEIKKENSIINNNMGDTIGSRENNRERVPNPVNSREMKSPFQSFDEEEFDRLNSRLNKNDQKSRRDTNIEMDNMTARRANNNFSSTATNNDTRIENTDKYKVNSGTLGNGKKPFTPSPVISPVYGILDKNYKKDDIVDKQGGLKREKIVKPVAQPAKDDKMMTIEEKEREMELTEKQEEVKEVKPVVKEEVVEVDIDSVRKKAYGELNEIDKKANKKESASNQEVNNKKEEKIKEVVEEPPKVDILSFDEDDSEINIEDELDNNIEPVTNDKELDEVVAEVVDKKQPTSKSEAKNEPKKKSSKVMDEIEKTSTLQILDDIEKELNSIKPISNDEDEDDMKEHIERSDTLENDLFNLIDSMYEEGEEEEND